MFQEMAKMAALPSPWPQFPPDLLGLVLQRLPSLADRVRLRAACLPWRATAQPQQQRLPPPLPWLALRSGDLIDLHGDSVRCAPILRDGVARYLAVDNLALLLHKDGGCSLVNPLSDSGPGSTTPLPKLAEAVHRAIRESKYYVPVDIHTAFVKAVLSSCPLQHSDPVVAVKVLEGTAVVISISSYPYRTGDDKDHVADIAFCHGKLYALTEQEGLHVLELDPGCLDEPGFRQLIANDGKQEAMYRDSHFSVIRYLVESNDRLLMVRRRMSVPPNAPLGYEDRTRRFEVFEADFTTTPHQWLKVDSLGDQAIFLSSECSKSVLASQCASGVRQDCIYFMNRMFDSPSREFILGPCLDPLGDSGVYNMRDGDIMSFLPEPVMEELRGKQQFMTWFFPADA